MTDAPSGSGGSRSTSDRLDALFAALADEHRRRVLRYFQSADDDVASVDDLLDDPVEEGDLTRDQLEQTLHHVTLPKLADLGVIEYDARSRTVRYCGSQVLERVLTVVTESDPLAG